MKSFDYNRKEFITFRKVSGYNRNFMYKKAINSNESMALNILAFKCLFVHFILERL